MWEANGVERQECGQKKGPILCILAGVAGADALVEEGGWSRNTMAGLACGGDGIARSLFDWGQCPTMTYCCYYW